MIGAGICISLGLIILGLCIDNGLSNIARAIKFAGILVQNNSEDGVQK